MSFWAVMYTTYAETSIVHSADVSNSFTFATGLNGGFVSASFLLTGTRQTMHSLYSAALGQHVVVFDSVGNRAFEGFVNGSVLTDQQLQVNILGYYAKGQDIIDDRIYVTSPTTISDIIVDATGLVDSWVESEAAQGGASYDLMLSDPDTGSWLALDFTDKRVNEAIESTLVYGYDSTDPKQIYLVIYEHRIPTIVYHYGEYDLTSHGIYISRENISGGGDQISANLDNVYNKVYAIYASEGAGVSKTTAVSSTLSQDKYGIIEGVVQNGGNQEGITMANALRDFALEKFQWPIQSATVPVSGVLSMGGAWQVPAHMIRAGDIVRFTDIDVMSLLGANYVSPIRSKIYSQVMATSYNASTGENNLTLGTTDNSFDTLMQRLGLTGGIK